MLCRGRRLINITVSKYHCINPIWYKFLIFWIVSKNFRWYKKYCFYLTKYFLIQKYLYQKNLRKIWWYKKYLYQKYFLWRIVIQIFSRMGDTNFSNFVSPTFRVIQILYHRLKGWYKWYKYHFWRLDPVQFGCIEVAAMRR